MVTMMGRTRTMMRSCTRSCFLFGVSGRKLDRKISCATGIKLFYMVLLGVELLNVQDCLPPSEPWINLRLIIQVLLAAAGQR